MFNVCLMLVLCALLVLFINKLVFNLLTSEFNRMFIQSDNSNVTNIRNIQDKD